MGIQLLLFIATFLVSHEAVHIDAVPPFLEGYDKLISNAIFEGLTIDTLKDAPLPDPLVLPVPILIDFANFPNVNENVTLVGTLNICEGATIHGLSLLEFYPKIRPTNFTYVDVLIGLYTETITIVGKYDLGLNVTLGDKLSIVRGSGDFTMEMVGGKFVVELLVRVNPATNHFRLHNMALHLGSDCLAINLDGTTVDGVELNWVTFSTNFKASLDNFWNSIRQRLAFFAQLGVNMLLSECTIDDALALDFAECINETLNPTPDTFYEMRLLEDLLLFSDTIFSDRDTCPPILPEGPQLLPRATCDWLYEPAEESTDPPSAASTLTFGAVVTLLAILTVAFL